MSTLEKPRAKRHPIQVVARRTGLSPDVLRAWERRYGAVRPVRTPTGRRLYSDEDVARLRLLERATRAGRSIGQVAPLDDEEITTLLADDEAAAPSRTGGEEVREDLAAHLAACRAAVEKLDVPALEQALTRAALRTEPAALLEGILIPLMHDLGESWASGRLGVVHEHVASSVARTFLGRMAARQPVAETAPHLLVATLPGESHELGALVAAVTAITEGWRVTYLGPGLPAAEIADAVEALGARAVALSFTCSEGSDAAVSLESLLRSLPEALPVLVGGAGSDRAVASLSRRRKRLTHLDGLGAFRLTLARIAPGS